MLNARFRARVSHRHRVQILLLSLAAALASPAAIALEAQVHGFLDQGFVLSEGNRFFGPSDKGSFQYYEAGLNGFAKLSPRVSISAQALARDAGATDDGGVRLDYGFADYRAVETEMRQFGLRVGRVKNPYGLFNDTRDVVFTRPGIVLPLSVYYGALGARALLFSSDGAQFYGGSKWGSHYLSASATLAANRNLDENREEIIAGDLADEGEIRTKNFRAARIQNDWAEGRWTAAASYFHGQVDFRPNPGVGADFDFKFDLYMLSARYSAERFVLTGEYGAIHFDNTFGQAGVMQRSRRTADGLYLQADYFLNPAWTWMLRYDVAFGDTGDRGGSDCTSGSGRSSACHAYDLTTGLSWRANDHWGVWGEYHWINGTYTASQRDNAGRTLDAEWSMLLLMVGYRF